MATLMSFRALNPTQTTFPEENSRIVAFDFPGRVRVMIAPGNCSGSYMMLRCFWIFFMMFSISMGPWRVVVATMFCIFGLVFRFVFSVFAVSCSSCLAFSTLFVPTLISLPDQKMDTFPSMFFVLK